MAGSCDDQTGSSRNQSFFEIESDNIEAPPSSPYNATRPNASIIPTTVPSKPIRGDREAMTDKGYMRDKCCTDITCGHITSCLADSFSSGFHMLENKRSEFPNVEGYLSQAAIAPFKSPFAKAFADCFLRSPLGANLPSLEVSKRCKAITKASNPKSKYNGYIMNPPALICAAQSICTPCGCSSSLVVPSSYTSPSSSPSTGTGVAISLRKYFRAFFLYHPVS